MVHAIPLAFIPLRASMHSNDHSECSFLRIPTFRLDIIVTVIGSVSVACVSIVITIRRRIVLLACDTNATTATMRLPFGCERLGKLSSDTRQDKRAPLPNSGTRLLRTHGHWRGQEMQWNER